MAVRDIFIPGNRVQTVTEGGTGLTSFTLKFGTQTTASIAATATAATVQTALENLSNLDPGDVTVTGNTSGPYTVTFAGNLLTPQASSPAIPKLVATPTGGTGTVTVAVAAPTVTEAPIGVLSRNGLDIHIFGGLPVWVRNDGGTPAAYGLGSHTNWYSGDDDPQGADHIYLDSPPDGYLRILPGGAENDVRIRVSGLPPLTDILRLNRGYGFAAEPEYIPLSTAGVTIPTLQGRYGPAQAVRVDLPVSSSTSFAVTADGTTPSLSSPANTLYGGQRQMLLLSQGGSNPAQGLAFYASAAAGAGPFYARVQKILSSARPEI